MSGRRTEQRDRLSAHGAAMSEAVMVCFLGAILSLGLFMLFGDDVRALFASADNSLAGQDSTPATRTAAMPLRGSLAGLSGAAGPDLAGRRALMQAALERALNDPNARVHGDWQNPVNVHPEVASHIRSVSLQSNDMDEEACRQTGLKAYRECRDFANKYGCVAYPDGTRASRLELNAAQCEQKCRQARASAENNCEMARAIDQVRNGLTPDTPSKLKLALGGISNGLMGIVQSLARFPETLVRTHRYTNEKAKPYVPDWVLRLPGMITPLANEHTLSMLANGLDVAGVDTPGLNDLADGIESFQQDLARDYHTFGTLAAHAEKFNAIGLRAWQEKSLAPLGDIDSDMAVGAVFTALPSLLVTVASGSLATIGAVSKADAAVKFTRAASIAGMIMEGQGHVDNVVAFEHQQQRATGDPAYHIPDEDFVMGTVSVALIAGMAEALGGRMVWRGMPGGQDTVSSMLLRMLKRSLTVGNSMVAEGGTEGFQQYTANLAQKWTFDPSVRLTDGVLQSVVGGAGSAAAPNLPSVTAARKIISHVDFSNLVPKTAKAQPSAQVNSPSVIPSDPGALETNPAKVASIDPNPAPETKPSPQPELHVPAEWNANSSFEAAALHVQVRSLQRALDQAHAWSQEHGPGQASSEPVVYVSPDVKARIREMANDPTGSGEPSRLGIFTAVPGRTEITIISNGFDFLQNGKPIPVSALAEQVRAQGHIKGQPVVLYASLTGRTSSSIPASLAEQLANQLESPVISPTRYLSDGSHPLIRTFPHSMATQRGRWALHLPHEPTFSDRLARTERIRNEHQQLKQAGKELVWDGLRERWVPVEWSGHSAQEIISFRNESDRAEQWAGEHGWNAKNAHGIKVVDRALAGEQQQEVVPGGLKLEDGVLPFHARAGWTTLRLSTTQDGTAFVNTYSGERFSPADLARLVKANGGSDTPVVLEVGYAGNTGVRSPVSLAEQLANETGQPVLAPKIPSDGQGLLEGWQQDPLAARQKVRWETFLPGDPTYDQRLARHRDLLQQRQNIEADGSVAMWDDEKLSWRPVNLRDPDFVAFVLAKDERLATIMPKDWKFPTTDFEKMVVLAQLRSYQEAVAGAEAWARQHGWTPEVSGSNWYFGQDVAAGKEFAANNMQRIRNSRSGVGDRIMWGREGWTEMDLHGNNLGKMYDPRLNGKRGATPQQFKDSGLVDHQPASPILLNSCSTGKSTDLVPANTAQAMANAFQSPVVAPTRDAWGGVAHDGWKAAQLGTARHRLDGHPTPHPDHIRGVWRLFLPQSGDGQTTVGRNEN